MCWKLSELFGIIQTMKYVVVETGGKQYKVEEGSVIEVEKLLVEPGKEFIFDKVLMVADGDNIALGHPYIDGCEVTSEVLEQKKGKKVRVAKFKAKARYRRVQGHRQMVTTVKISSIKGPASSKIDSKSVNKAEKDTTDRNSHTKAVNQEQSESK